jgi:hypothetical protein
MTLAEAVALIAAHTKRPDVAGLTTSMLIKAAVNMARKEIQQWWDFSRTKSSKLDASLAVDESVIALESDVFKVLDPVTLVDPSNDDITGLVPLKPKAWVKERYPYLNNGASGNIVVCYVDGTNLIFVAPAMQAWTVQYDYFAQIADLTDDAEVLEVGLENAIVSWATAYVFKSTQQRQEAEFWMRDYATAAKLAREADTRDRTQDIMEPFTPDPLAEPTIPEHLDWSYGRNL